MSSQLQVSGEAKIRDIQGPVVANSGIITALDGAASQYVRGDGTLADFPTSTGGGSSVSYYLNSSVSQGTIGGVAYRELSKEPIIGAGTDIAISSNGYVASYLTDANDPDVVLIPGGNFNCEFYFSVNNNTGNPFFYAELYKYDGTTFTLLGSSVGVPEYITQGTIINPYYFAIPVATATLALTDRLAIRIYVNVGGRTVTLHTENGHLCQVVTTLSKGMVSLNNLTDQSQFLTTGTSGTNFAIVSSGDTHTFNLPVASAANTGKLSSTDWSTFNGKQPAGNYVTLDTTQTITAAKTFTGVVSSIADTNAAAYILQGRTSDDLAQIQYKNNAGSNTKAIINFSSVGTNGGGIQFLVKPQDLPIVSSLILSPYQADFETSVTSSGSFTGTSVRILNSTFTSTIGASLTANRTITLPDLSGTLALLEGTQTFTGLKTFGDSIQAGYGISLYNGIGTGALVSATYTGFYAAKSGTYTNITFAHDGDPFFSRLKLLNNATYDYTFPAASGTIALTSNLSAYVPYTGATGNVNLGTNSIILGSIQSQSGILFNQLGGVIPSAGFTSISGHPNGLIIRIVPTKVIQLEFPADNFIYTYPSATGTLALTSDLGAYVTLATTQTISGAKTFSSDILVSGVRVGIGSGGTNNTRVGPLSFMSNTTGSFNTAIGTYTLNANTTGSGNTALGNIALIVNTTGQNNTAIGAGTLGNITTGSNNTGLGIEAGISITTGSNNTIIGNYAGTASLANNIVLADGQGNIRYQWNGTNNVFGNPISGTSATFSSSVTASSFISSSAGNANVFNSASATTGWVQIAMNNTSGSAILAIESSTAGTTTNGSLAYATILRNYTATALQFATNNIVRATITSGGNVGIGTSSPNVSSQGANNTLMTIQGQSGSYGMLEIGATTNTAESLIGVLGFTSTNVTGGLLGFISMAAEGTTGTNVGGRLQFSTKSNGGGLTERMRITSGGYLKASNNGTYAAPTGPYHEIVQTATDNSIGIAANTAASPYGLEIAFRGADPNNATNYMLGLYTTSPSFVWIYRIWSNGTVSARSDARWKKNIETTRNGYLEDLCKLRVVKYNWYNHEENAPKELGLIAQEVEEVFPNLISYDKVTTKKQVEQEDGSFIEQEVEDGESRSVKTSVLPYMLLKGLQEAKDKIENLQAQIEELSNKIVALESK